jgi:hypothetical protein
MGQLGSYLASTLFSAAQPLLDWVQQSPANFVTQTPPPITYGNPNIQTLVAWAIGIVDTSALALILLLAGYQIMVGLDRQTVSAFLPRIIMAFVAAQSSLQLCQWMIDFNNALCIEVIDHLSLTMLQDTISLLGQVFLGVQILKQDQIVLIFFIGVFLIIEVVLLAWQMLVRTATILLLIALSPFGLFSLASSFFERWGRLWVSAFTATVLVQFFQVTALSIGGELFAFWATHDPWNGKDPILVHFLTAAGTFYLVLQLPGMLHEFALRPTQAAGTATSETVTNLGTMIAGRWNATQ